MKRILILGALINVCLFLWQCKKMPSDKVTPVFSKDCYTGNFKTALNQNEHIADMVTLPDNTIAVLSSINSTAAIKFYDSHGRPMSAINIPIANNAIAMNMLYTADGGFIISYATNSFISHKQYMTGNANYNYFYNVMNPCNTGSSLISGLTSFDSKVNNSQSFLCKIDMTGKVIWTKTFSGNFYSGTSLAMMHNNILFMNISNNLTYSIDSVSSFNNNLLSNYADSNVVHLHCINLNGNAMWNKEYDSITGIGDTQNGTPVLQGNIQADNSKIILQSGYTVLVLNAAGVLITKPNIRNILCGQYSYNSFQLFGAVLDSNVFDVYMPASTGVSNGLVLQYDFKSNLINYFGSGMNSTGTLMNMQTDKQHNLLLYDGFTFVKYDNTGNVIFNVPAQPNIGVPTLMSNLILKNCDNGYSITNGTDALSGSASTTATLQIIKTDGYGHF